MKNNINTKYTGDGKVVLLSGGGKCYTDIAARFVGSNRELDDIIASDYDAKLVRNIINSGHLACTEFDYFIFGVEGYSRVTEIQLVRKRLANYMISSGRSDKQGKRSFDVVIPKSIQDLKVLTKLKAENTYVDGCKLDETNYTHTILDINDLMEIINNFYEFGVQNYYPEEDLRYLKPQATEFKAIIGMNAHALLDWFKIRCCKRAQHEIRDMANKMLKLCKEVQPELFKEAGPACASLGYCPENGLQHPECKGKILTHKNVKELIKRSANND